MPRKHLLLGAIFCLVAACIALLPQGVTSARWVKHLEVETNARTSEFFIEPEASDSPGVVWNHRAIRLENRSAHDVVVKVDRLSIAMRPHSAPLGSVAYVRYRESSGQCVTGFGPGVWPKSTGGPTGWIYHNLQNGYFFTGPANAEMKVPPKTTRWLCPEVALDETSNTPADYDRIFRRYSGMAFDLTTELTWRSQLPATWERQKTVENTYRIEFPDITMPKIDCKGGPYYTDIHWKWPAVSSEPAETKAIAYWEAWYLPDGGTTWERVSGKSPVHPLFDRIFGSTAGQTSSGQRWVGMHNESYSKGVGTPWSGTLRIRAVLDGAYDTWVQSTSQVRVSYSGSGHIQCSDLTTIPRETNKLP